MLANKDVPLVLINREKSCNRTENFLFLEGDLDDNIEKLMKDIGFEIPKIEKKVV